MALGRAPGTVEEPPGYIDGFILTLVGHVCLTLSGEVADAMFWLNLMMCFKLVLWNLVLAWAHGILGPVHI